MRVVLDTNVLVSAFLFVQRLGSIVRFIQQGAITPCFVVSTFRELEAVRQFENIPIITPKEFLHTWRR